MADFLKPLSCKCCEWPNLNTVLEKPGQSLTALIHNSTHHSSHRVFEQHVRQGKVNWFVMIQDCNQGGEYQRVFWQEDGRWQRAELNWERTLYKLWEKQFTNIEEGKVYSLDGWRFKALPATSIYAHFFLLEDMAQVEKQLKHPIS